MTAADTLALIENLTAPRLPATCADNVLYETSRPPRATGVPARTLPKSPSQKSDNPFDHRNVIHGKPDSLLKRALQGEPIILHATVLYVHPWRDQYVSGQVVGYEFHVPDGNYCLWATYADAEPATATLRPPFADCNDRRQGEWYVTYEQIAGRPERNRTVKILSVQEIKPMTPPPVQTVREHMDAVAAERQRAQAAAAAKPTGTPGLDAVFGPRDADASASLEEPPAKQHEQDPAKAPYAMAAHIKREHQADDKLTGIIVRKIFGTDAASAIKKHGVAKCWEMIEQYDRDYPYQPEPAKAENAQISNDKADPRDDEKSEPTTPETPNTPVVPKIASVQPATIPAADKTPDPVTGEIVVYDAQRAIERMMQRSDIMASIHSKHLLKAGTDYGVIPGTDDKKTLLKPGAEKLCTAFGLCPEFHLVDKVANWNPDAPLFYFQYECRLIDMATGKAVASGIGSCNSMESKYRWRSAKRTCPKCGKELRKSKDKPEYYCWTKTDGCGATFKETDPVVKNQEVGKVPNDDIFSLINTLDKMAQKRALIAATLIGANASAFYTQDVENLPQFGYIEADVIEAEVA